MLSPNACRTSCFSVGGNVWIIGIAAYARSTPELGRPATSKNSSGKRCDSSFWSTDAPMAMPHTCYHRSSVSQDVRCFTCTVEELTPANERQNAKNASACAFSETGSGDSTGKYVTAATKASTNEQCISIKTRVARGADKLTYHTIRLLLHP